MNDFQVIRPDIVNCFLCYKQVKQEDSFPVGVGDDRTRKVCGQCYLLTSILDQLKEIKKCLTSMT